MSKINGMSVLHLKGIFLLLQVINLSLFIAVLNTEFWFLQKWDKAKDYDDDYSNEELYYFRGGLLATRKSSYDCYDESTFNYCYKSCIDYCDEMDSDQSKCEETCERYQAWHAAGVVYVAFQTIASFLTVLIAIFIILTFFRHRRFKKFISIFTTAKMMIFVFICNLIAFVVYAGTVRLNFYSCKHKIDYEGIESVCPDEGAIFALVILFWLIVVVPSYVLLASNINKMEKIKATSNHVPENKSDE